MIELSARFEGCLLGLAVGDALGGLFEAQTPEFIRSRFSDPSRLIAYAKEELYYTDDTQMAIGVAETLVADGEIEESNLCKAFVANYVPSRGYGRGARAVLDALESGEDYRTIAENHFPGGSYGNGAAMRIAPIGLMFRDNIEQLLEQARLASLPTHLHPLGIEGARMVALAVSLVSKMDQFDCREFFKALLNHCKSHEFRTKFEQAERASQLDDLAALGNGIEALQSAPTAIASFALTPDSYELTIGNVILLGGDTDTMAAMAGAISGAFLGVRGIPSRLLELLENEGKGRDYIRDLSHQLYNRYSAPLEGRISNA